MEAIIELIEECGLKANTIVLENRTVIIVREGDLPDASIVIWKKSGKAFCEMYNEDNRASKQQQLSNLFKKVYKLNKQGA